MKIITKLNKQRAANIVTTTTKSCQCFSSKKPRSTGVNRSNGKQFCSR